MEKPNMFSPGRIGQLYLRNRIVMAPLGSRLTSENGAVTKDMIDFYALRAKGGTGLIVIEAMGVDFPLAVGKPNHVRINDDCYIPGHAMLTERIHEHGAKVFPLLWHTGINRGMFLNETPVGPSAVLNPITGIVPHELTVEEIHGIVEKFGQAAKRCMLAGYDGIGVHAGHGYLISSFVSRDTNHRTDAYGGSMENRCRFALEIVKAIQKNTRKGFPILFRINGSDFTEKGISLDEATEFSKLLEQAGVDALDISAGVYPSIDTMIEPIQYKEGWKLNLAEHIKRHVSIPVAGVGVMHTPEAVNAAVTEGRVDFVSMGRELLCEPEWVNKVKKGDNHLLYCIGCNACFERIGFNAPLRCAISPLAGRETHVPEAVPAGEEKKIAVVGAGPAGIHVAVTAAKRGHNVALFESAKEIGGQLILAAAPPGKEKIYGFMDYMKEELARSSVTLHLGKTFTMEDAKAGGYDNIILATGAKSKNMPVPGTSPITAWEVLSGGIDVKGKHMVVVGAGSVGCETALYAKEKGAAAVAIVELREKIGMDIDMITRTAMLRELGEAEIGLYPSYIVETVAEGKAVLAPQKGDAPVQVGCDMVVTAVGSASDTALAEALYAEGYPVETVGDAVAIGKIGDAVRNGFNIAAAL